MAWLRWLHAWHRSGAGHDAVRVVLLSDVPIIKYSPHKFRRRQGHAGRGASHRTRGPRTRGGSPAVQPSSRPAVCVLSCFTKDGEMKSRRARPGEPSVFGGIGSYGIRRNFSIFSLPTAFHRDGPQPLCWYALLRGLLARRPLELIPRRQRRGWRTSRRREQRLQHFRRLRGGNTNRLLQARPQGLRAAGRRAT